MNASSVAQTGSVEVEDVVAGWKLVTDLLRPVGMAICEHIDGGVAGFTYIVYQPLAHRAGRDTYLFAGASARHPLSHHGLAEFGPTTDANYWAEAATSAVRFVVATTGEDGETLNVERQRLLTALNVADDPRFWNQADASASDWTFAPAGTNAHAEPLTA
jgi:hypothetical protein